MLKGMGPTFFFQMPLFVSAYAAFRGFAMHPWLFESISFSRKFFVLSRFFLFHHHEKFKFQVLEIFMIMKFNAHESFKNIFI